MGRLLVLTCMASISGQAVAADKLPQCPDEEHGWIQLFNGKDLKNWKVKIRGYALGENPFDTFRVQDGVLRVSYDNYENFDQKFGHIFYDKSFSHYRLRVEYRFVGEQVSGGPGWAFRNNGLMLHCQPPKTMTKDQSFPVSLEAQLLGGKGTGERPTANLCTPGTNVVMNDKLIKRHCISSTSKTYHGDQWVTVEIEVRGNKVVNHIIDGKTVLSFTEPQLDERDKDAQRLLAAGHKKMIDRGYIALQAESHDTEFRKIELLPLDNDAPISSVASTGTPRKAASCCENSHSQENVAVTKVCEQVSQPECVHRRCVRESGQSTRDPFRRLFPQVRLSLPRFPLFHSSNSP